MLHLDPRVHLQEEVVAVAVEQPFDRAGAAVADRRGGVDAESADPLAELRIDRGRWRFLDEFLVAPLDRAVALPEVDHIAMRVREDLNLDVPRILEVTLDVDGGVREVGLALTAGGLEGALGLVGTGHDPQALPAAAGRGLDRDRPADLGAEAEDVLDGVDRCGRARHDRHARGLHGLPGGCLRAHHLDRLGRGPDPDEPRRPASSGEARVLGEEAVAGVNGFRPGARRRLEQPLLIEVALGRRARPDQVGLVGRGNV